MQVTILQNIVNIQGMFIFYKFEFKYWVHQIANTDW